MLKYAYCYLLFFFFGLSFDSDVFNFYEDAARFMRIGKYPISLVGKMDETPAFFDMVLSKCILKKGEMECVSFLSEWKKYQSVILSVTADRQMLLTMIISKEKSEQTIRDLNIPPGFVVKTEKKSWMDDGLTKV